MIFENIFPKYSGDKYSRTGKAKNITAFSSLAEIYNLITIYKVG